METTRTSGRRLRRPVFATDRSAASRAALLAVAGLAVGGRTEVVVLHVDDRGQSEDGRRLVDQVSCGLIALAVNARPELRPAAPGQVGGLGLPLTLARHGWPTPPRRVLLRPMPAEPELSQLALS